jgi:hypothetical protein
LEKEVGVLGGGYRGRDEEMRGDKEGCLIEKSRKFNPYG